MSEINDIIQAFKKHDLIIKISIFFISDVYLFDKKILIEIAFYVLELKFLPFHHLCFCQINNFTYILCLKGHVSLFLSLFNPKMAVI